MRPLFDFLTVVFITLVEIIIGAVAVCGAAILLCIGIIGLIAFLIYLGVDHLMGFIGDWAQRNKHKKDSTHARH